MTQRPTIIIIYPCDYKDCEVTFLSDPTIPNESIAIHLLEEHNDSSMANQMKHLQQLSEIDAGMFFEPNDYNSNTATLSIEYNFSALLEDNKSQVMWKGSDEAAELFTTPMNTEETRNSISPTQSYEQGSYSLDQETLSEKLETSQIHYSEATDRCVQSDPSSSVSTNTRSKSKKYASSKSLMD